MGDIPGRHGYEAAEINNICSAEMGRPEMRVETLFQGWLARC
jgi:hypothetical protein